MSCPAAMEATCHQCHSASSPHSVPFCGGASPIRCAQVREEDETDSFQESHGEFYVRWKSLAVGGDAMLGCFQKSEPNVPEKP